MDRLILITGASRGIGAATAVLAARHGYTVGVNYRTERAAAEAVCAQVGEAGGSALLFPGDVGTPEGIRQIFAAVDDSGLPLTALVNNAGIVGHIMPFTDYTDERLQRTFAVNVYGAFACAREAVRRMLAHGGGGAVVNVSSAAARIGSPDEFVDYAASKGAVDTLTLGLAKEFGPQGIRVNAVRPGIIRTTIHANAGAPDRVERFAAAVPLRRAGEAEEVAESILWLLSDGASYVTGALLDVAGGR
ncbi:MAG: SDR family oxidoreductase [Gammaproteobacteria bacterium]